MEMLLSERKRKDNHLISDILKMYPGMSDHFDYGLLMIIKDQIQKLNASIYYDIKEITVIDEFGNEHSPAEILLESEKIYQEQLNM